MPYTLKVLPSKNGYSIKPIEDSIVKSVDGGAQRVRKKSLSTTAIVNCQWALNPDEYDYLKAFYRLNKDEDFLANIFMESHIPEIHTCRFVPQTFGVTGRTGKVTFMAAQLEVAPNTPDQVDDEFVVELYDTLGVEEARQYRNDLWYFVNEQIPVVNHINWPTV